MRVRGRERRKGDEIPNKMTWEASVVLDVVESNLIKTTLVLPTLKFSKALVDCPFALNIKKFKLEIRRWGGDGVKMLREKR